MKKKIFVILFTIILIAILLYFGYYKYLINKIPAQTKTVYNNNTSNEMMASYAQMKDDIELGRDINKISVYIKEGTLTPTGATMVIKDDNEYPYGYGETYYIQKKKNDKWENLMYKDTSEIPGLNDIALLVGEDHLIERELDWRNLYGELEPGDYRIGTRLWLYTEYKYFWAEFTIE